MAWMLVGIAALHQTLNRSRNIIRLVRHTRCEEFTIQDAIIPEGIFRRYQEALQIPSKSSSTRRR